MKILNLLLLSLLFSTTILLTSCDPDPVVDPNPSGPTPEELAADDFAAYFSDAGNTVTDPAFAPNSVKPTSDLGTNLTSTPAGLQNVNYKGAVDPNGSSAWYEGWSAYENIIENGITPSLTLGTEIVVTDEIMLNAGNTVNWTKNNTYILDGFVFVNEGQTLNIQAGTVIQGKPGEGSDASALIVARGARIEAEGTETEPIIFTFEGDLGETTPTIRGQWGGLVVLGKASINSSPGTTAVEGIPTTETRGLYGGTNDLDDSGILKYISIRHGGTNIGADNEINGLTLGGVGSETTLDYIEIIGNKDDGIEWFGGTASVSHLISAYCADDGLDYDEGYRGVNQFIIVHQDPSSGNADRGGEHDGGTDPETGTPYATPMFFNVTSVGNNGSRAITFRDNAGGEYHNSIFVNYAKGVDIEYLSGQNQHTFVQFEEGNLKLENNVFYNIDAGDKGEDLFKVTVP